MEYFINIDKKIYGFKSIGNNFSLYYDEKNIISIDLLIKDFVEVLPVQPILVDDRIILFNYDKGIYIIYKEECHLLKIRSIYKATLINDKLVIFTNTKKIYIVDYQNFSIINEISVSENFDFCMNSEYALFYRLKNNESFLYDIFNKEIINLKKNLKKDILIKKIMVKNNNIYIFYSCGSFEMQKTGVFRYNFETYELVEEDCFGKASSAGFTCLNYFEPKVNENIKIDYSNYGTMINTMIKKYGVFYSFHFADSNKISELYYTNYRYISESYDKFNTLINEFHNLKSNAELNQFFNAMNEFSVKLLEINSEI